MKKKAVRPKFYAALNKYTRRYEVVKSNEVPSNQIGYKFSQIVGPFRTKRGASYFAKYGYCNSHCKTIADAEKLAKLAEE
jgi:hypothetical protein